MSSLDGEDIPSLSFQKAEINAFINPTLIQMFLMGIYTVVYSLTVYLYAQRQASGRWRIMSVITAMYISLLSTYILRWYRMNIVILESGDTMLDTFNSIYYSPDWLDTVDDLCQNIAMTLADGLLMWRCWMIWNGSRRVIWAPCALWLAEVALAITDSVVDFYNLDKASDYRINIGDQVSAAQFFTSGCTSLVATYLIGRRIYNSPVQSRSSKELFRKVINIVIESAAVYTVCVVALGIFFAIPYPDSDIDIQTMDLSLGYAASFIWVFIGLTPTVMVARVALSNGNETSFSSTLDIPSKILFQSQGAGLRESWNSNYSNKYPDDGHWRKEGCDVV